MRASRPWWDKRVSFCLDSFAKELPPRAEWFEEVAEELEQLKQSQPRHSKFLRLCVKARKLDRFDLVLAKIDTHISDWQQGDELLKKLHEQLALVEEALRLIQSDHTSLLEGHDEALKAKHQADRFFQERQDDLEHDIEAATAKQTRVDRAQTLNKLLLIAVPLFMVLVCITILFTSNTSSKLIQSILAPAAAGGLPPANESGVAGHTHIDK